MSSEKFKDQKSIELLKKTLERAYDTFCPHKKKIMSRTFRISGALIVIPV